MNNTDAHLDLLYSLPSPSESLKSLLCCSQQGSDVLQRKDGPPTPILLHGGGVTASVQTCTRLDGKYNIPHDFHHEPDNQFGSDYTKRRGLRHRSSHTDTGVTSGNERTGIYFITY